MGFVSVVVADHLKSVVFTDLGFCLTRYSVFVIKNKYGVLITAFCSGRPDEGS